MFVQCKFGVGQAAQPQSCLIRWPLGIERWSRRPLLFCIIDGCVCAVWWCAVHIQPLVLQYTPTI